ncbi:MAG: response regulator transcription factor [Candidatus Nealsonbacteria bacterium]|nr:response regulator transcription factor [Candidatus Nealsonbacteria bacterium]
MLKKILLVEDEKVLGEMYKAKFIQAGFEVVWTFEAKEALNLTKKEKPDSFLRWLRKEPEISQTPVVAFSNYDDPETKKKAFELGVKDYLIKTNYTPSEVVERVKQLLSEW